MDRIKVDGGNRNRIECLGLVSLPNIYEWIVADDSLVALKILLGLSLLSYSALRQTGMQEREAEDTVNDFGRSAVGERKEEAVSHVISNSLTGRNTTNAQASISRKTRMIYHSLPQPFLEHVR